MDVTKEQAVAIEMPMKSVEKHGLNLSFSEHQHFDRDWLSIMVNGIEINPPPKDDLKPQTWRDREPLL